MTRTLALLIALSAMPAPACFLSFEGTFQCAGNAPLKIFTCGEPVRVPARSGAVSAQVEVGPITREVPAAPANTMWLAYTTTPATKRAIGITPDNHLIARDEHALYISDTAGSQTAGAFLAAVNTIAKCEVDWKNPPASATTP